MKVLVCDAFRVVWVRNPAFCDIVTSITNFNFDRITRYAVHDMT